MAKLVIIGDGEFAEIAYEYFTHDSAYEVIAFSVEKAYLKKQEFYGLPVYPFENIEQHFSPADCEVFVAVTYTQLNRVRARLYAEVKKKGYKCASYISSRAFVWRNATIGENVFIFENNVIQHHVLIDDNVILWSGNHIGHRSVIEKHCYLASHIVISGYCTIREYCFLGVNSTLADHVTVEKDCVIGAGAVILRNTEPGKVYQAIPAEAAKASSLRLFKVKEAI